MALVDLTELLAVVVLLARLQPAGLTELVQLMESAEPRVFAMDSEQVPAEN